MAPNHETSERVYAMMKSDLLSGALSTEIQIGALADRYAASITPVREALLRMVGERLVLMKPTGGFAISRLSEAHIRDLYDLNLQLTLLATAWRNDSCRAGISPLPDESTLDPPVDLLFRAIARRTGNLSFLALIESMNDQMQRIRHAEERELKGLHDEFVALEVLVRHGTRPILARAVRKYHLRRMRISADIARRIRLEDTRPPKR